MLAPDQKLAAWRNAYVFPPVVNGSVAAFVWSGGVVVFAHTGRGVEVVADLRGTPVALDNGQRGFTVANRRVLDGGGCACHSPLKRVTWETVEAHLARTLEGEAAVT